MNIDDKFQKSGNWCWNRCWRFDVSEASEIIVRCWAGCGYDSLPDLDLEKLSEYKMVEFAVEDPLGLLPNELGSRAVEIKSIEEVKELVAKIEEVLSPHCCEECGGILHTDNDKCWACEHGV